MGASSERSWGWGRGGGGGRRGAEPRQAKPATGQQPNHCSAVQCAAHHFFLPCHREKRGKNPKHTFPSHHTTLPVPRQARTASQAMPRLSRAFLAVAVTVGQGLVQFSGFSVHKRVKHSPPLPTSQACSLLSAKLPRPRGDWGTSFPSPGSAAAMLAQLLLVHLLLLPAASSADHHRHYRGRRALHEPLFPLESTPTLPPPPPAPFFPFLPGAAAPPTPVAPPEVGSASTPADTGAGDASSSPHPTAPANISSLAPLPVSHGAPLRAFLSSHRLLTVLVLVVAVAAAVLTAALVYILARRQRRHSPKEEAAVYAKPSSLAPANPVPYDGGDQHGRGSTATVSSASSPELRPMPPLPRQFQQTQMNLSSCSKSVLDAGAGGKRPSEGAPPPPPPPPPPLLPPMPPVKDKGGATAAAAPPAPPPPLPRAGNGSGWLPRRHSERPPTTVIRASASAVHPEESPGRAPSEKPADADADALPKLKPLHWDKVRASSGRPTVWDQLKASSFR
jgi:hypothetical protein